MLHEARNGYMEKDLWPWEKWERPKVAVDSFLLKLDPPFSQDVTSLLPNFFADEWRDDWRGRPRAIAEERDRPFGMEVILKLS